MWWGYSPSFDIREEVEKSNISLSEPCSINILLVGCSDMRHVIHTIASSYKYEPRRLNFSIYDPTPELVARQTLFLASILDDNLSGINKARTYLEIFGNSLLRQDTYSYLIGLSKRLSPLMSDLYKASAFLPVLDFSLLRYRDRDSMETIFRFWGGGAGRLYKRRKVDMTTYWDGRLRKYLGVRYDYLKGVIDWDFQMRLHKFMRERLRWDEYYRWRKSGVAFAWMESEPSRVNPTLISGITTIGDTLEHFGYMGDILNPPHLSYGLMCTDQEMHRTMNGFRVYDATAFSERNITRYIHEILSSTPYIPPSSAKEESVVITELSAGYVMPDDQDERNREYDLNRPFLKPESLSNCQVTFLPIVPLNEFIHDPSRRFQRAYDVMVLGQGFSEDPPETLIKMVRPRGHIFVESKRFLLGNKEDNLKSWSEKVIEGFTKWKCVQANPFSASDENYAKFILNTKYPDYYDIQSYESENMNKSDKGNEIILEEECFQEEFTKMREEIKHQFVVNEDIKESEEHQDQKDSDNFLDVKEHSNLFKIVNKEISENSEALVLDLDKIKSQMEQLMSNNDSEEKKSSVIIEEIID